MALVQSSDATFKKDVLEAEGPVLVDFWAPWCGPCKMIGPILEELANEYAGKLNVVKINVDENQSVAQQYGIMSIPTLILFNNGSLVEKSIGVLPKPKLVEWLKKSITL